MSFNLSHSLHHTCTPAPVPGGGGIESDSRWESQTSLSWEHGCQQLICPILHPLCDCRLAHFAHNKSASSSSVSRCASMNYLTLLSLSLSLSHCLLSICRLFRWSLSLWFSLWSREAHWSSVRYEKNNNQNSLNKSLLSEFSWNKNTVNSFELPYIQSPE